MLQARAEQYLKIYEETTELADHYNISFEDALKMVMIERLRWITNAVQ